MKHLTILVVLLLAVGAAASGCTDTTTGPAPTPTQAPTLTPKPTPTKTLDTATMGEKNAVEKAKSYLRVMAFSREGLIDQLEYEGFTQSQAEYGVRAVGY